MAGSAPRDGWAEPVDTVNVWELTESVGLQMKLVIFVPSCSTADMG